MLDEFWEREAARRGCSVQEAKRKLEATAAGAGYSSVEAFMAAQSEANRQEAERKRQLIEQPPQT